MLMGRRRSVNSLHFEIYAGGFVGFILISTAQIISGSTDSGDVAAINNLYVALDYPALPHWTEAAGDPCGENWQGVMCNNTAIISIVLNGANLGGKLGDKLGMFSSIKVIDLSNNHIGGSIPSNLPATIQNFFLSANQFTGSIPYSLSSLGHLTAMSLNDNHLTGGIPDSFQILTGLINLDLSNNNLSGQLPPSMFNLLSLTTLHLQNNMLSGTLSVLQDLPLRDLNVEKNQFSGPVPDKMLNIPNFRKDGNPFDTSAAPLPSPTAPLKPATAPPFFRPPTSQQTPANRSGVPSATEESKSGKNKNILTTKRVVWISISSVLVFVIMALGLLLFMPRCCRAMKVVDRYPKQHGTGAYKGRKENPPDNGSLVPRSQQTEKDEKGRAMEPNEKHQTDIRRAGAVPKPHDSMNVQRMGIIPRKESHEIDITGVDMILLPPPPPPLAPPSPPPPPPRPLEVIAEVKEVKPATKRGKRLTTVKLFTIASLQQFTNSFSEDNLIGAGMLGSVYRAQLADGKLLAVKKLDYRASSHQKDDEFLELVEDIDKIRHANVVELIGYCAEHGQRLLIYEYCSNGTLKDALHSEDEFKKQLSWNARIQIALGAARALEYLHEVCQPPVVHRNFKSANLLLDDDLSVRVSDCGLAPLISSGSVSQLSGQLLSTYGYGAPEFELGVYTCRSDVYSFGVVMLELLTGRKSHDRTRNRGEQFLVRWAIPQLHDIDALLRMVDPSLNGKYPAKSLSNFADIISRCVQVEPEFRPQMSEVVQDLLNMIRREPSQYRSEGGE